MKIKLLAFEPYPTEHFRLYSLIEILPSLRELVIRQKGGMFGSSNTTGGSSLFGGGSSTNTFGSSNNTSSGGLFGSSSTTNNTGKVVIFCSQ